MRLRYGKDETGVYRISTNASQQARCESSRDHSRTRYDHNEHRLRVRIEVLPRKSRDTPTSSGVYQIRCKQNGEIYVGSAVNLQSRWHSQRRDLRNGVHVNPHLQFAWNLYGETNLEFPVLEYVDEQRLLTTEQLWIDKTGCTDRLASRMDARARQEESAFCRTAGLCGVRMFELKNGKRRSHKGWTWKYDADKAFE
jgi:predicted GIY-YIG superfamily endonuclease